MTPKTAPVVPGALVPQTSAHAGAGAAGGPVPQPGPPATPTFENCIRLAALALLDVRDEMQRDFDLAATTA